MIISRYFHALKQKTISVHEDAASLHLTMLNHPFRLELYMALRLITIIWIRL